MLDTIKHITDDILSFRKSSTRTNPSLLCAENRAKWFGSGVLFAICDRPSVCLSVVCLSVTVMHPTQAVEIFGNIFTAFGTLAID